MNNVIKEFFDGFASLFIGLKVTFINFLRKPITLQYPWERWQVPERSRGILRMWDYFDGKSTDSRSTTYPGTRWAPCILGCPAATDARGYVTFAGEGKFKEGLALLKRTYPFVGTLGRVCPAPCESLCSRGYTSADPIAIRKIKGFYDRYEQSLPPGERFDYKKEMLPQNNIKVAVIGAGPSGVQAAFELATWGFDVTIYERTDVVGGYVMLTIPDYRLAKDVLAREVQSVLDMGVKLKLNTEIGKDITIDGLMKEYKAVVIAAGATKPIKLGIPGEETEGAYEGEPFLESVFRKKPYPIGKKVLVIGGGSTATDAARTALRMGAKASILYRRTRMEMPASPAEVHDAVEEGVELEFLLSPLEVIIEKGKVKGLKVQKNKLGPRDKSGRRSPVPIPGSEYVIECDQIITALGRGFSLDWVPQTVKRQRNGAIDVDRKTGETSMPGLYASGDSVKVSTIIEAIAGAKRACHGIAGKFGIKPPVKDLYPTNGFMPQEDKTVPDGMDRTIPFPNPLKDPATEPWKGLPRNKQFQEDPEQVPMPMQDPQKRIKNWNEVEHGFTAEMAQKEGKRCLSCMSEFCISCGLCVDACPSSIIYLKTSKSKENYAYADTYSIDLTRCVFCGLCTEACPTKSLVMSGDYEFAAYKKEESFMPMERLNIKKRVKEKFPTLHK
ncbi:MAG: FAD-dependent oxidoreductase [Firmicutes bacterium]|nr:FAD-dependent oxidoreductase [Bacillota bacterium]